MGTMKEYIDEAERALLHTYNRFQIVSADIKIFKGCMIKL